MGTAGHVDALALAVVDADLVGLFEVMTAPERRRRGLARALTAGLLRWGRMQRASTCWLAVAAENLPAVRLYEGLGFREAYRYHYRSNA
jgi:ribosomal protein S18 acetylase RimI-like enzyme